MDRDPVLSSFIYSIAELPCHPPVTLNTDDEQLLLLIHQLRYKAISLFLCWIRLGESQSALLLLPEIQVYEPLARFWDSLLTLAIETHPRTEDELIRAFGSPANLWYACLLMNSQNSFNQALAGYPQPRNKKESIKNARVCLKALDQLDLFAQLKFTSHRTTGDYVTEQRCPCLTAWLLLQAGKIASQDPSFDKKYYRPCLKAFKKIVSAADRCDDLQLIWIDLEGQLFITGQTKKLPPSTKK